MACPNADRPCPGCPRLAAVGDPLWPFGRPEAAAPVPRGPASRAENPAAPSLAA